METFMPSEIARLVLGYLKEENCIETTKVFMHECTHLNEYVALLQRGREISTEVVGMNLKTILNEYGNLKLSEKSPVSSGLTNLWDRFEMLNCQLRHAVSPYINQSLPTVGKDLVKGMQSFTRKQAMRNRYNCARTDSVIVRSDVSLVHTVTNTSSQPTTATPSGIYHLVSSGGGGVNRLPNILPKPQNTSTPSTRVLRSANLVSSGVSSNVGLSDDADGRESSHFNDDLESLVSHDEGFAGFRECGSRSTVQMIDVVGLNENDDINQPMEVAQVIQIQQDFPAGSSLLQSHSCVATSSNELSGSPSRRPANASTLSCGSVAELLVDTSLVITSPKSAKLCPKENLESASVSKAPVHVGGSEAATTQFPLPSAVPRDRRKKAQPYKKRVSNEQVLPPRLVSNVASALAQQHQSSGAGVCAGNSDLGIDANVPQLLERLINSQTLAEKIAENINRLNGQKLSKEEPSVSVGASVPVDKTQIVGTESKSFCPGDGKFPANLTEPGNHGGGYDDFYYQQDSCFEAAVNGHTDVAFGTETSEAVFLGGKCVTNSNCDAFKQKTSSSTVQNGTSSSMPDFDMMTDAAIDNIIRELCSDPTLDSLTNGNQSQSRLPTNKTTSDPPQESTNHDEALGHVTFTNDYTGFLVNNDLESNPAVVTLRSELRNEGTPAMNGHTSTTNAENETDPNVNAKSSTSDPLENVSVASESKRQFIQVLIPGFGGDPDRIDIVEVIGSGFITCEDNGSSSNFNAETSSKPTEGNLEHKTALQNGKVLSSDEFLSLPSTSGSTSQSDATVVWSTIDPEKIKSDSCRVSSSESVQYCGEIPCTSETPEMIQEHSCSKLHSEAPSINSLVSPPENTSTETLNKPALAVASYPAAVGEPIPRRVIPKFICPAARKSPQEVKQLTQRVEETLPLQSKPVEIGGIYRQVDNCTVKVKRLVIPEELSENAALPRVLARNQSVTNCAESSLLNPAEKVLLPSSHSTCSSNCVGSSGAPSPVAQSAGDNKIGKKEKHRRGMLSKQCRVLGRSRPQPPRTSTMPPQDVAGSAPANHTAENLNDSKKQQSRSIITFVQSSPVIDLTETTSSCETVCCVYDTSDYAADKTEMKPDKPRRKRPSGLGQESCPDVSQSNATEVKKVTETPVVNDIKDDKRSDTGGKVNHSDVNSVDFTAPEHLNFLPDLSDDDSDLDLASLRRRSANKDKNLLLDEGEDAKGGEKEKKVKNTRKKSSKDGVTKKRGDKKRSKRSVEKKTGKDVDANVCDESVNQKCNSSKNRSRKSRKETQSTDAARTSLVTRHKMDCGVENYGSPTEKLPSNDEVLPLPKTERRRSKKKNGKVISPKNSDGSNNHDFHLRVKFSKKNARHSAANTASSKDGVGKCSDKENVSAKGLLTDSAPQNHPFSARLSGDADTSNHPTSAMCFQPNSTEMTPPDRVPSSKCRRSEEIFPNLFRIGTARTSPRKNLESTDSLSAAVPSQSSARSLSATSVSGTTKDKKRKSRLKKKDVSSGKPKFNAPPLPASILDKLHNSRSLNDSSISCNTLLSMPDSFDSLVNSNHRFGASGDRNAMNNKTSSESDVPRSCLNNLLPDGNMKSQPSDQVLNTDRSPDTHPGVLPVFPSDPDEQQAEVETAVNALLLLADDSSNKQNVESEFQNGYRLSDDPSFNDIPRSVENDLDDSLFDYATTGCSDIILDLSTKKHLGVMMDSSSLDSSTQPFEEDHSHFGKHVCKDVLSDNLNVDSLSSNIELAEAAKRFNVDCSRKSIVSVFSSPNLGVVLRIDESSLRSPSTPSTSASMCPSVSDSVADDIPGSNAVEEVLLRSRKRGRSSSSHGSGARSDRVSRKKFKAMNIETFLSQVHS